MRMSFRPTVTRAAWLSPYLSSMRGDVECVWTWRRLMERTRVVWPIIGRTE